jgi:hypothetical protein
VVIDPIKHCLQSGSGRVLSCLGVTNRLAAGDPGLMFRTPILNQTILIKEALLQRERHGALEGARVATKLYLPFDGANPLEGGRTVFFGQRTFDAAMTELLDLSHEPRRKALEFDKIVLRTLDELPTLAPFLLKDKLERAGLAVSPLYFEIADQEWNEIRRYIRDRFRLILDRVVGGHGTAAALERLIDALWDLQDTRALENLAKAFGLPSLDAPEIFYSWKGVLYFAWEYARAKRRVHEMLRWFLEMPRLLPRFPAALRPDVERAMTGLQAQLVSVLKTVEDELGEYEGAFNELFLDGKGSTRFTGFLRRSRAVFQAVGGGVGQLQHASEIWDELTRSFPRRQVNYEVILELEVGVGDVVSRARTAS